MFWFKKDKITRGDLGESPDKKVKFIRAYVPKNAHILGALETTKKVADHLNKKFDLNFRVYMERYGRMPVNTIYIMADFDSVAQLHTIIEEEVPKDLEAMAMLEILGEQLVDGSNYDTVLFDMD